MNDLKRGRRFLAAAAMILLFVGERARPGERDRLGPAVPIMADAVPLDRFDPDRRQVGRLLLREAWALRSADPAFGGFSALAAHGRRFLMVSDGGTLVSFALDRGGGIRDVRHGDLTDGPGDGRLKESRDAESLAHDPATGEWLVGFERANAIGRYDPEFRRLLALARPASMADWPDNAGAEAMARLPDGRVLVFAEGGRTPSGARRALLFDRDPTDPAALATPIAVTPPDGFRVTDAAALPDGRIIALHRRASVTDIRFGRIDGRLTLTDGFSAAIAIYDTATLPSGALRAERVATLAAPLTVDNMEGIAVVPEDGRLFIWILSDDNQKSVERTLLMRFELLP
ncbi:hypothetical protein GGR88_002066 [Sphingomonas jejuensis]|uniref:Phytase-like domain-containing protein n=1 Tax=Sphingomonas jejuensis TaxID=904715 RepID=A0ABX0XNW5_9SPHN|nr:esterase-like activity of phytase family protein [Sphingomonas jejuensis]NJC34552.1 hypothetical protein [Sphingomonas jejuensis]